MNYNRNINEARCLKCDKPYQPDTTLPAAEYPYCTICNMKEKNELASLRSIRVSLDGYLVKPGKRAGMKTSKRSKKIKDVKTRTGKKRDTQHYYFNEHGFVDEKLNFKPFL